MAEETYGQRLRTARKARRLPLREAGRLAGISATYVSDLERDAASPSIAVAARLAAAFGVLPAIGTDYTAAYEDGERSGYLAGYDAALGYLAECIRGARRFYDLPSPTRALADWIATRAGGHTDD